MRASFSVQKWRDVLKVPLPVARGIISIRQYDISSKPQIVIKGTWVSRRHQIASACNFWHYDSRSRPHVSVGTDKVKNEVRRGMRVRSGVRYFLTACNTCGVNDWRISFLKWHACSEKGTSTGRFFLHIFPGTKWYFSFLSAAQPTDQGEESVVLVVVGGGTIFQSPMCSFLGCEEAKTLSKKGVWKGKNFV